jgi:hypothetical protein
VKTRMRRRRSRMTRIKKTRMRRRRAETTRR